MYCILNIILIVVSALGLVGSAFAAPINMTGTAELAARGANSPHYGWATYYDASEGTGACGHHSSNSDHVVAIGKDLWEQTKDGNGASTKCGKTATVSYKGKSVKVRVVDECPVCGYDNIDLSPSAFEQLGDKNEGRLNGISWKFD